MQWAHLQGLRRPWAMACLSSMCWLLQGANHHLQSVSASSTGNLLRMSQAARRNLETDVRMSEDLHVSATPAEDGGILLDHHDAELDFQSHPPSTGMFYLLVTLLWQQSGLEQLPDMHTPSTCCRTVHHKIWVHTLLCSKLRNV